MKRQWMILLWGFWCSTAAASGTVNQDWRIYNSLHGINDIEVHDGAIWCATTGGLAEFNPLTESFEVYDLLNGIAGTVVNLLEYDTASTCLWLVVEGRSVQRFDLSDRHITNTVSPVREVSRINDLTVDQRGVYLATDNGVARIKYYPEYDEWFWFERYTKLGIFSGELEALALTIDGDYIWIATSEGVARGDLNTPAPLEWINFNNESGLPNNNVKDIVDFDGMIYAATDGGVALWDGLTWSIVSGRANIVKMLDFNGELYAIAADGLWSWDGHVWVSVGEARRFISSAALNQTGNIWIGLQSNNTEDGGIAVMADSGWSEPYVPNSPSTNRALSFAFMDDGSVLMVGGRGGGEFGLNNMRVGVWQYWAQPKNSGRFFGASSRGLAVDHDNGAWVGTFGGGIARFAFNMEGSVDTVLIYDDTPATGARLAHNSSYSSMVITADLAADQTGNIWVVNWDPEDRNVLICIPRQFIQEPDSDFEWYYFNSALFSNFALFDLIAVDNRGRKWLATTAVSDLGRGVYVFDDNGTLDNRADDRNWGPVPGLNQQQANCLASDPAGYMWVGTIDGAYYIETEVPTLDGRGFTQFYYARDEPINAITIDSEGNKWLGTNHGIMIVAPDLFTVTERITTAPPYFLPDSTITAIEIDPYEGWAYIGTNNGTVAMRTPYRDYGEKIDEVTFEPNPFNPNRGRMFFTGSTLAAGGSIRIYTPDGRLVRTLNRVEAGLGWNGFDYKGNRVAGGVYLILAYNGKNQSAQGKVAVVWE